MCNTENNNNKIFEQSQKNVDTQKCDENTEKTKRATLINSEQPLTRSVMAQINEENTAKRSTPNYSNNMNVIKPYENQGPQNNYRTRVNRTSDNYKRNYGYEKDHSYNYRRKNYFSLRRRNDDDRRILNYTYSRRDEFKMARRNSNKNNFPYIKKTSYFSKYNKRRQNYVLRRLPFYENTRSEVKTDENVIKEQENTILTKKEDVPYKEKSEMEIFKNMDGEKK